MADSRSCGSFIVTPQPASGARHASSLYVQVLIAIVVGILLGHLCPISP